MLKNKLLLVILLGLFIIISLFAIVSDLSKINNKLNNIEHVNTKIVQIKTLTKLIKEIQKDRGLTNLYFSNKNKKYLYILTQQQKSVINLIEKSSSFLDLHKIKSKISVLHMQIRKNKLTQDEAFDSYTSIILQMINKSGKLLLYTDDKNIKNSLIIHQKLNFIQEYMGQLRAFIASILTKKAIDKKDYIRVVELNSLIKNYLQILKSYASYQHLNILSSIEDKLCVKQTYLIVNKIINNSIDTIDISALQWFNTSSCAVDTINLKVKDFLNKLQENAQAVNKNISSTLNMHVIFWVICILVFIMIFLMLYKIYIKMLEEHRLLVDYKKAIDNSTIVSKTNKKGIITYVNKTFCEISGYTEDELIGKPHNIVRHPDVPALVFKDLWKTIKAGNTWTGVVKNLAKDNEPYWVDAAISPIYDHDNNLVEYIAIRHDITDTIKLNDEIQNTQHELIYRMGESVESRSKESGNHIRRVAHYSKILGSLYGLDSKTCDELFIASTMHDMGKIAIPDSILLKPGQLDSDEWNIMKTHAQIGYKILAGSNLPILQIAAQIAHEHHERYDGKGYPQGLSGKDISIYARIVSIADVFDALISDRVYKKAWEYDRVIKLFEEEQGLQFDPHLINLFLTHINEFMKIKERFED